MLRSLVGSEMCIRDRLITSSPKYLFLLAPSNPHTVIITSSLLTILYRFSKCSFHTPLTSISSVTKTPSPVSYTHLRAHETPEHLVCRLLLEKKNEDVKIVL